MFKKQLLKFIYARLFIFSGGQCFRLNNGDMQPVEFEVLKKSVVSFLVVGKEHYKETDKRYPVSNAKDLNDILKYQAAKPDMSGAPRFFDDHTLVPFIELDGKVKTFLDNCKWAMWLPESWVLNFPKNELIHLSRANTELYALSLVHKLMLSPLQGPFKSKSYFLMSVGASEDVNETYVDQKQYVGKVIEGFENISKSTWLDILNSQRLQTKLAKSVDWFSAVLGALVGIVVFQGGYWGILYSQELSLDKKISQQNVAQVVRLQKQFEESKTALTQVQSGGFDKLKVANLWDVLLVLMENQVNLIRITSVGSEYELYLNANAATDTLELLRTHDQIKDVKFSTPVRQSGPRENFGVVLSVKSRVDL